MKKLAIVFAILSLVGFVRASEMLWMINNSMYDQSGVGTVHDQATDTDVQWTTARLMANTTGYNFGTGVELGRVSSEVMDELGKVYTTFGSDFNPAGYSFYVELLNGQDVVAKTYVDDRHGGASYEAVKGSIATDVMDIGSTSPYSGFSSFTSANVIPEPTSGLLLAIGMMMLGLKRKRA